MKLYIVRHGQAQMLLDDKARALTSRGVEDIHALAENFLQAAVQPEAIWHSPYRRTQETYQILQAVNQWPAEAISSEFLTPVAELSDLCEKLAEFKGDSLLLISHQPLVSMLTAWLVEADARAAFDYPFEPGSVACLELPSIQAGVASLKKLSAPPYL